MPLMYDAEETRREIDDELRLQKMLRVYSCLGSLLMKDSLLSLTAHLETVFLAFSKTIVARPSYALVA